MLAAKSVLAQHDRIPVLVFDEVDANLGGEAGNVVGAKLNAVGKSHQVICITHLPQVAVFGSSHFAVSKHKKGDRTVTKIENLKDRKSRVDEIARMLGGLGHTNVTEKHASALLDAAR